MVLANALAMFIRGALICVAVLIGCGVATGAPASTLDSEAERLHDARVQQEAQVAQDAREDARSSVARPTGGGATLDEKWDQARQQAARPRILDSLPIRWIVFGVGCLLFWLELRRQHLPVRWFRGRKARG